jgi:hypothetical protein
MKNKERLIEICSQITEDVKNDAEKFDGMPLTGKTVGEYFGYHGAAIATLADILKEVLINYKDGNIHPNN